MSTSQQQNLFQNPLMKELKKAVPGFFQDKSEPWYTSLKREEYHWLTNTRREFLASLEDFDKANAVKERKDAKEELLQFVREILPKCKELSKIGIENEKRKFDETYDPTKRLRLDEPTDFEEDYAGDEYMPKIPSDREKKPDVEELRRKIREREMQDQLKQQQHQQKQKQQQQQKQKQQHKPKQENLSPVRNDQEVPMMWTPSFASTSKSTSSSTVTANRAAAPTIRELSPVTSQQKDPLLDDITDPMTRDILNDLRLLILKYDCRDRVLRAIKGLKSGKKIKDALVGFDDFVKQNLSK